LLGENCWEELLTSNASGALARIQSLTVIYALKGAGQVHALDNVSLQIDSGETVGILGESGSGKTTLAKAIMRTLPANATCSGGEILIDNRDLLKLPETELHTIRGRAIAMIPQDPALCLNPVITVGCQILEVLRAHVLLSSKARKVRVLELLREVGFEHPAKIASAYPHQLSGGQRQRVTIAQAISCCPSLVIADEPTSKLDATLEGETIDLLSGIRRQHRTALLVITHDPGVLAGWVDRIAVMYAGRIIEIGDTKQVLRKPFHPYTQALVQLARSSDHNKTRLPTIEGNAPNPTDVSVGCRFEPRCSERMERCKVAYPTVSAPESDRQVSCFKYEK